MEPISNEIERTSSIVSSFCVERKWKIDVLICERRRLQFELKQNRRQLQLENFLWYSWHSPQKRPPVSLKRRLWAGNIAKPLASVVVENIDHYFAFQDWIKYECLCCSIWKSFKNWSLGKPRFYTVLLQAGWQDYSTLNLLETLLVQTRHTKTMSFDSTSLLHGQKVAIYFEHFP